MHRLLPSWLLLLLPSCTSFYSDDKVLITSDPPGARVFIDGRDMGVTTPTTLAIGGIFGYDHELSLLKKGYRIEVRRLCQYTEGYTTKWRDGIGEIGIPALPIFWTLGDVLTPFDVRAAIVPGEVYVKLYRNEDPLLGWDALREQQQRPAGVAQLGQ
jgi:hypothetical protein